MLAALAPTLAFPFGRDQATFAYMAQTILRGEMPYRDAWEVKPPGIYLLYSLVLAAAPQPGSEMLLVRLADCAVALGIAVLLARILAHLGRPEAGPAAALFYAALYLQGSYWSLAQAESWANLLVLMLVWIVLSPARKGQPLAVGLLLGGITGLKFTSLLPTLPFVWLTLRVREPGWPGRGGALLLGCI
ncbi:MAG: hypothetical protein FJX77_16860, partial [Armatimonadetes bacterium]|nr:hypothetical protein [Armatimonadota bacterium]